MTRRRTRGRIGHVPKGTPYHKGNSIRGIDHFAQHGYPRLDIDILMDADGNLRGCHWPRPMTKDGFRDPLRRANKATPMQRMKARTVDRLRAPGGYRITRLEKLLDRCKKQGIVPVLEPKNIPADPRMKAQATWDHIAAYGKKIGLEIQVRALPENQPALAPARRAGLWAWPIG